MTEYIEPVLISKSSKHGRSTVTLECPYCKAHTECFTWSLGGSGKRCECGAKHTLQHGTRAPEPKKKRKQIS